MYVPAAMNIYSGAALLRQMPEDVRQDHLKELHAAMGTLRNEYKLDDLTPELFYLLGISTARAMLKGSTELILKGANPDKVL